MNINLLRLNHPKKKQQRIRKVFTAEEDEKLTEIMNRKNFVSWETVSKEIPGRNARQCRDRWLNYLAPSIRHDPWTHEEDIILVDKINQYGTKWSLITKFFEGRSDNRIKNRWYSYIQNHVQRDSKGKLTLLLGDNSNSTDNESNNPQEANTEHQILPPINLGKPFTKPFYFPPQHSSNPSFPENTVISLPVEDREALNPPSPHMFNIYPNSYQIYPHFPSPHGVSHIPLQNQYSINQHNNSIFPVPNYNNYNFHQNPEIVGNSMKPIKKSKLVQNRKKINAQQKQNIKTQKHDIHEKSLIAKERKEAISQTQNSMNSNTEDLDFWDKHLLDFEEKQFSLFSENESHTTNSDSNKKDNIFAQWPADPVSHP